ncbi:transketolase [Xanthomonas sp. AmX2]|uniref:1-deoxy-D-xylulose-5-phosphate synthase N-terminal domain-containing protein n=1 Tax=Xanthomonas sp. TaxID=29446 RepID=UPI001980E3B2|nr:transketolase [Xanthomonas sp.]
MDSLDTLIADARARLLRMHFETRSGHVGGNLSCLDALLVLHHRVLQAQDRFILSKGHAAGALYVTLWSLGLLTDDDLLTFGQDASRLPGHPSGTGIPGLLFSTGSLGHGPSLAAGLALAARMQDSQRRVYCLCSDGEWQEGSCWEALTFAVHQRLDNLTIMVDQNGLQGFGTTQEVISCSDLSPRLLAFGAHVVRVDGHDTQALQSALMTRLSGAPTVLVMDTVKGRGAHYAGLLESHYLPLTQNQYDQAKAQLANETP